MSIREKERLVKKDWRKKWEIEKFLGWRDRPLEERDEQWFYRFWVTLFLGGQVFWRIFQGKIDREKIRENLVTVGLDSIKSVILIAFFAGMIFSIQTARELIRFGAVASLGGAFALSFCRELAPVLTAGIVAGQVGSAFAAEIGEMQVTEQIDALYMLKTNPVDYLVIPRVIASCLMLPILTIFALVLGIFGGMLVASLFYHLPSDKFLESVRLFLQPADVFLVVIKGFIFGGIIGIVGCGLGLTTTGGGKGVGRSATAAVVTSWILIFIADFVLSLLMFHELAITKG